MKTRQLTLCGSLTALAAAVLMLGGMVPAAAFAAPLLAMAVLLPILEEYGVRSAGIAYAGTAILALLLTADRETALVYLFFGWYPLVRPRIAKLPSRLLRVAARLAICNLTVLILYGLVLRLLGLTAELEGAPVFLNAAALVMGNAVFLMLDQALLRLTRVWRDKLRRRLFRR